jgi:anti-sigma factor RsiW
MTCDDVRSRLSAYLDDELPAFDAQTVATHLAACAACAAEYEALLLTGERVRQQLPMITAPDVLRARIRSDVRRTSRAIPTRRWRAMAAAVVLLAVGSGATVVAARLIDGADADALISAHMRSLLAGHVTDVVSTDQHTVKPWFAGKVAFAPAVPRLDSLDFPLAGGRLDNVNGRSVAALVYRRRQHLISVFVWPERSVDKLATGTSSWRGYNRVEWAADGLRYDAVSDLNAAELAQFATLFRSAQ